MCVCIVCNKSISRSKELNCTYCSKTFHIKCTYLLENRDKNLYKNVYCKLCSLGIFPFSGINDDDFEESVVVGRGLSKVV